MKEAAIRAALERIEKHMDKIYVRYANANVALWDLPTSEALQRVCGWIREILDSKVDPIDARP